MNRGHGTIVAGVHRLQHVESFLAPYFANNNPVRSHPQAVIPLSGLHCRLYVRVWPEFPERSGAGQFSSTDDLRNSSIQKTPVVRQNGTDADNKIEVKILTESAFTVWQNGYETSTLYESGRVREGIVQADVPAGADLLSRLQQQIFAENSQTFRAAVVLRTRVGCQTGLAILKGHLSDWLRSD